MERTQIRRLVMTGTMAAVLCVLAPWSIPVGPVPISLCSLLVGLCACIAGRKGAAAAVVVYILAGAAGLPVFSGFMGGLAPLMGPTGGYIFGYVLLALLVGGCVGGRWRLAVGFVFGTGVLYLCGTAWYCLLAGISLGQALAVCVLPFLPGDLVKLIALMSVGPVIRDRLERSGVV